MKIASANNNFSNEPRQQVLAEAQPWVSSLIYKHHENKEAATNLVNLLKEARQLQKTSSLLLNNTDESFIMIGKDLTILELTGQLTVWSTVIMAFILQKVCR